MKYLKMLALAAVAAGALTAFIGAGTASASTFCSTTVESCPSAQKWPVNEILEFTLTSGTSAQLVNTAGESLDTCKSSKVKGPVTNAGSSTETLTGSIEELTWGTCTFPTTTTLKGKLEVHKIAGTSNGTVTADGETRVTINTIFFGSCVYTVPTGESIGDITEGNPAIFHANAVAHQVGENVACPATSKWTATYTLTTTPGTTLSVD